MKWSGSCRGRGVDVILAFGNGGGSWHLAWNVMASSSAFSVGVVIHVPDGSLSGGTPVLARSLLRSSRFRRQHFLE